MPEVNTLLGIVAAETKDSLFIMPGIGPAFSFFPQVAKRNLHFFRRLCRSSLLYLVWFIIIFFCSEMCYRLTGIYFFRRLKFTFMSSVVI